MCSAHGFVKPETGQAIPRAPRKRPETRNPAPGKNSPSSLGRSQPSVSPSQPEFLLLDLGLGSQTVGEFLARLKCGGFARGDFDRFAGPGVPALPSLLLFDREAAKT